MAVFLDVLPRLGLSEAEAAMAKLRNMAAQTGKEMGISIGDGATAGLNKLKDEAIATERVVSDTNRKMIVSYQQYEAQVKKVAEVEAVRGRDSAAYAAAMARQTDLTLKATTANADHAAATAAAATASTKFANAEESKGKALVTAAGLANGVGKYSFLAFGAAVGVAADKAAHFEQSQTKLVASAGETAAGVKQVSDGILAMAGSVGYSAGELSSAMYVVEKAGFDAGKGGLDVLKASAQGANAEQADLAEVTKGLTISLNDFHFKTSDAADIMSKLVVATGASNATFQEFTGALHSVEPAAAAAKIKYEDLLATIAQGTKSGASADQVTENIRNAISALSGAQGPARDAMRQIGIDADDISQHLGERGLSGTFQYLADTIKSKMDPNNLIPTGEFKKNAGELDNLTNSLQAMSPAAAEVAQGYRNGTVTAKEFRAAVMGASGDDIKRLQDFKKWSDDLNDFSTRYKNGQSTLVTYNEELRKVTGTVAGQSIALQVTGENAEATNKLIDKLNGTTRESDGTVKGFNETQETLSAKLRDAKAGFGAAGIEIGNIFIPALKKSADALKDVAEFLAQHKKVGEDVVKVIGLIGGAWVIAKGIMVFGTIIEGIKGVATAFNTVKTAATGASTTIAATSAAEAAEVNAVGTAATATSGKLAAMGRAAGVAGGIIAGVLAMPHVQNFENDNIPGASFFNSLPTPENLISATSGYLQGDDDAFKKIKGFGTAKDQAEAKLKAAQAQGSQYGGPGAEAARRGATPGADGITPSDTDSGALPVLRETPAPGDDPGTAGSGVGDTSGGGKKPKGDKQDPIWIAPQNPSDFKSDTEHGVTGTSIIAGGFDLSPKSIGTFFSALLVNLALGNPIGKGLADKLGGSPSNPMYITSVDVDKAQTALDKAIQGYGPDSTEAKTAAGKLAATQAAVGTTGGYFDPKTGTLSARDPSKSWSPGDGSTGGSTGGAAGKQGIANMIVSSALNRGYSPDEAKSILAYSIGESGLNPGISGGQQGDDEVIGLFQEKTGFSGGHSAAWRADPQNNINAYLDQLGKHRDAGDMAHQLYATSVGGPFYTGGYGAMHGLEQQAQGYMSNYTGATPPAGGDGAAAPFDLSSLGLGTGLPGGGGGGGGTGLMMPDSPVLGGGTRGLLGSGTNVAGRGPGGGNAPGVSGITPGSGSNAAGGGPSRFSPATAAIGPGSSNAPGGGDRGGSSIANAPRTWGSGKGASSSVGSSIMAAAGPALDMIAPGSGEIAKKGGQLIDRTIGYAGQLGGIAVEGLMQSLIPTGGGGGIGDPSKSLLGRIAGGFAGAHKSNPNGAGTTAAPGPKKDGADDKDKPKGMLGDQTHIGAQNNGVQIMGDAHISTPSPQAFVSDQPQNQNAFHTR